MAMVTRKDIEVFRLNDKEVSYKVAYELLDHVNYNLSMYQNTGDNMRKFAVRTTGNRLTVLIDLDHNKADLPIYTSLHKATEAAREIYRNELRHREAANNVIPEVYTAEKIGTLTPNESFLDKIQRSCKGPKHTLIVYKSNKRNAFKIVHKNALYPSEIVEWSSPPRYEGKIVELEMSGVPAANVRVAYMFECIKVMYCLKHALDHHDVEIVKPAVDK